MAMPYLTIQNFREATYENHTKKKKILQNARTIRKPLSVPEVVYFFEVI